MQTLVFSGNTTNHAYGTAAPQYCSLFLIQTKNKLDLRIFETLKVYKLKKKNSIILLYIHAFCAIASKIYLISNIMKLVQGLTTLLADGLLLCPTTTVGVTNFRSEPQTFKLIVHRGNRRVQLASALHREDLEFAKLMVIRPIVTISNHPVSSSSLC